MRVLRIQRDSPALLELGLWDSMRWLRPLRALKRARIRQVDRTETEVWLTSDNYSRGTEIVAVVQTEYQGTRRDQTLVLRFE